MRGPVWHQFHSTFWDASDVRTGDVIVCPGTVASPIDNDGSPSLVLHRQPVLVLSVQFDDNYAKITVLTRHGTMHLFQKAEMNKRGLLSRIKRLLLQR